MRAIRLVGSVLVVILLLGLASVATIRYIDAHERPDEARQLAEALGIRTGSVVAEIGAGNGALAVEVARIVGPTGRVIGTEVSERQLEDIRRTARGAGVANVTVMLAGEKDSNLPSGCCDAVYMQRVYHHLTDPAAVVASIGRALRPDGRLAVVDFEPGWLSGGSAPSGVPERGGHGVPKAMLIREMKDQGFQLVGEIADFGNFGERQYLAVFRR